VKRDNPIIEKWIVSFFVLKSLVNAQPSSLHRPVQRQRTEFDNYLSLTIRSYRRNTCTRKQIIDSFSSTEMETIDLDEKV